MGQGADSAPRLRRIEVVANLASGSVGPDARETIEAILSEAGVEGRIHTPDSGDLNRSIRQALDAGPDLLVIVAGDGTARCAAEMAGFDGPLLAPLPGGTMNMLPRALYGERDWATALTDTLKDHCVRTVSGGEVDGRRFYVAAMLGSPALFALAREAMRERRFGLAWRRAKRALRRTFSGSLHFAIEDRAEGKAEALALMCPLISAALDDDAGVLEAAALDPSGAAEAMRLGVSTLRGDWRQDPSVELWGCRYAKAWANGRIPATIDGEPVLLNRKVDIAFHPQAFRALAPTPPPAEDKPTVVG